MVCGETVRVGGLEIPEQLPSLVADGLAAGGVPWPAIQGLANVFPAALAETVASAAIMAALLWLLRFHIPPWLDGGTMPLRRK